MRSTVPSAPSPSIKIEGIFSHLGGGFGVSHSAEEKLEKGCSEFSLKRPQVTIEPGRWTAAEAGMTLYNVCSVKTVPGIKTWVAVDGGMGDNIRPALYTTGAYTFSMASNYNRVRRPAVVLVKGDRHRLSVRRQTFKDLIEGDM